MGKKDKKKGKGAEKTALKTEKKALKSLKKDLAAKGEVDIAKLIAKSQEKDKKIQASSIEPCSQPSPRSGFTLCPHPDKDELILFGGEYFNGSETTMFNELYIYNIKKDKWSILKCPVAPPPRCSHQAIVVSQNGGQMWIFGGEFASPTKCSFYHYRDLWVLHFATMTWEQVKAPGGPSARSGHRMVVSRKQIVLFGGFYEIIGDYKYFNDVHIFNLETYTWTKVEPTGKVPSPRSGCLMAPLTDGRILVYGGYSRERVKKDVDKGTSYTDLYYLQADERTGTQKWKWVQSKSSGLPPSPRSGLSVAVTVNNFAYAFGGVHDEQDEDELLSGIFQSDLYQLELEKGRWTLITPQGKGSKIEKRRRRKAKEDEKEGESEEEDIAEELEKTTISEAAATTYDDSIFTVKIGASASQSTSGDAGASSADKAASADVFIPKARMNAGMVIKNGILYLYGGTYEEGDKQLTLSDFHALNIHKVDEWRTLVPFVAEKIEWIESEESESDEDDADMDEEDDSDEDDGMDTS
ncbi:kelch domain-containing protein 4 [Parasteatoda tepidariorum]|uniref:kelch domain-containing protein 4 n=1 Tax=Parasteatoda tepidariorum TaxID=114398 RepID=UPI00077F9D16|nr:kelch domain-containing protein 4 [Parasteatoda tepidariorum]